MLNLKSLELPPDLVAKGKQSKPTKPKKREWVSWPNTGSGALHHSPRLEIAGTPPSKAGKRCIGFLWHQPKNQMAGVKGTRTSRFDIGRAASSEVANNPNIASLKIMRHYCLVMLLTDMYT